MKRMYEIVLEREPDGQGLKEWYDTLTAGTNTGADIMNGFFFSSEFQSKTIITKNIFFDYTAHSSDVKQIAKV